MPGMTTTRLTYTDYHQAIKRARNSEWQREKESDLANYSPLNLAMKNGKVPIIVAGNMKSN